MKKHLIFSLSLSCFLALSFSNCSEPNEVALIHPTARVITPTFDYSGSNGLDTVGTTYALATSRIDSYGNADIIQHGHICELETRGATQIESIRVDTRQTDFGSIPTTAPMPYEFTSYLTDLESGAMYTVKPYVTTKEGTFYGPTTIFRTLVQSQP